MKSRFYPPNIAVGPLRQTQDRHSPTFKLLPPFEKEMELFVNTRFEADYSSEGFNPLTPQAISLSAARGF